MAALDRQQQDLDALMAEGSERRSAAGPVRWQDVQPKQCTTIQRMGEGAAEICNAREVAANRKAVGDLIAAGDCPGALKGALGTGDLQFAREVLDFCGAK